MAKTEQLDPVPKKSIGVAIWKWLKTQQHFLLNKKVTVLSLSVWKFIHEDSLVRMGKRGN